MENLKLNDWERILWGEVPGNFYLELVIRATIIFILLIGALRLMGKRMAAQVSRNELASMVALAAAIGIPLQSPERGVLPALIIAGIIVAGNKLVSKLIIKYPLFEKKSQGNISTLVKDGVMHISNMESSRIGYHQLAAQLRIQGIKHLGQVKRFYLETGGTFSLVKAEPPKSGLPIVPQQDEAFYKSLEQDSNSKACANCGNLQTDAGAHCNNCGHNHWVAAVK